MLSVITLMDRITAHAALDTLEMEHHALVNHKLYPVHLTLYDLRDTEAAHQYGASNINSDLNCSPVELSNEYGKKEPHLS